MENTHEVRLMHHAPEFSEETLFIGSKDACLGYLEAIAQRRKCGVGLLVNNGGYSIVNLDEEEKKVKQSHGEQMADILGSLSAGIQYAELEDQINILLRKIQKREYAK